jgi:hypothetical protein
MPKLLESANGITDGEEKMWPVYLLVFLLVSCLGAIALANGSNIPE